MALEDTLDECRAYLERFIAYPDEYGSAAHTLWIAHTHRMDAWFNTPRLAFLSTEPGSGKSRALEVTMPLVPNPCWAVNVSPAYLFRKIDEEPKPVILYDEIDTVFGSKAGEHEDLRGLFNAGYRRGAIAGRCLGTELVDYDAFGAVAMAGLDSLPDSITTRSIIMRMKKRAPYEEIEQYRPRTQEPEAHTIRDALTDALLTLPLDTYPDLPELVCDREADVWECLIQIGDEAGDKWAELSRVSAVSFIRKAQDKDGEQSLGIRLLSDVRKVWIEQFGAGTRVVLTRDLLDALRALDESPWDGGMKNGENLTARSLSFLMGRYDITSGTIRLGDMTGKGYKRSDLWDAWDRYLPGDDRMPVQTIKPQSGPDMFGENVTPIRRICKNCYGAGCDDCGDWKAADGTPL